MKIEAGEAMKPSVIVWDLETVPDLGGFAAARGQDQGDRRILRDGRGWHLPGVAAVRTVSRHAEPECVRGERAGLSGFHESQGEIF